MPAAFLDRGAFEANLDPTATRAGDLPVRVAIESVRCVGVLGRLLSEPGFKGLMCYTGDEAADLAAAFLLVVLLAGHGAEAL